MLTTRGSGQPSVTLDDIRRFRQLDSKAPGHPEYHWVSGVETTTGPLGQGVATSVGMAIAAEMARQPIQQPGLRHLRLQHLRRLRRRLHDGGRRARKLPRWPAILASTTSAGSATTTTSPSKATRASPSRRMSPPDSSPTVGTSCESATRMTLSASSMPSRYSARPRAGPRSSCSTATSATVRRTNRTPPQRMANRSARRKSDSPSAATDGRKTRSFSCPTACTSTSRPASAQRGAQARQKWTELFTAYRDQYPDLATEIDQMQRRELPAGWDRNLPVFPGRPEGHGRARGIGQGAERARAEHPVVSRRLGGPRAVEQDRC